MIVINALCMHQRVTVLTLYVCVFVLHVGLLYTTTLICKAIVTDHCVNCAVFLWFCMEIVNVVSQTTTHASQFPKTAKKPGLHT